jgi:hypothetical protein
MRKKKRRDCITKELMRKLLSSSLFTLLIINIS